MTDLRTAMLRAMGLIPKANTIAALRTALVSLGLKESSMPTDAQVIQSAITAVNNLKSTQAQLATANATLTQNSATILQLNKDLAAAKAAAMPADVRTGLDQLAAALTGLTTP